MNTLTNFYSALLKKSRAGWSDFPSLFIFVVLDAVVSNAIASEHIFNKDINWGLFLFQYILVIFSIILWMQKKFSWIRRISFISSSFVIIKILIVSASLAINLFTYPNDITQDDASLLFRDALLLWIANILLFAVFYWLIDGGGSAERNKIRSYIFTGNFNPYLSVDTDGKVYGSDFLFPLQDRKDIFGWYYWTPSIIDYVFLAFSTSTAFSATDTLMLTWRSKVFTILQAIISLLSITILAARAINILRFVQTVIPAP